jgi:hypothetical protein
MNAMLKRVFVGFVLVLIVATLILAAENGENKFNKVFGWNVTDKLRTAWDLAVLPDLNNNGVNEILLACDNDDPATNNGNGADYYILERQDDNKHKVLWHSFVANVIEEYTVTYGDADNDGNLEIIACMRPGVVGAPSLVFWEVDKSLPGYPLPTTPTCGYDLTGGTGWARAFSAKVADVDKDGKNELMVSMRPYSATGTAGTRAGLILQDNSGDLAFPDFKEEFRVTGFNGTPYGITTGDADNDGFADVYFGEYDYAGVFVLENTAPDSYKVHSHLNFTPYSDNSCRHDMSLYDFNEDGFSELVYTCNESGDVLIVTNPGEIALMDTSSAHVVATLPWGIYGSVVGDQEWTGPGNDGRDIYCAADTVLYDVEYIGGKGGDVTKKENWVVYPLLKGDYFFQPGVGDFDRDGRREVVVCSASDASPEILQYVEHEPLPNFGVKAVWNDPSQKVDPKDQIKGNPRGFWVGSDMDKDGKKEIFATQYTGKVVCYEVTADNKLEMVWVDSTAQKVGRSQSLPRHVVIGDMDKNGKQELIFLCGRAVADSPDSVGFYFYEWNGKDNGFGSPTGGPTYILPINQVFPACTDVRATEFINLADVDGDGREEMLLPNNGTGSGPGADFYGIFSCVDGTLESGFPTFKTELYMPRAATEMAGGPVGCEAADVDGDGVKEPIFIGWDLGKISVLDAVKPDSFVIGKNIRYDLSGDDAVFYVSLGHYDIDGDGAEELMGASADPTAANPPGFIPLFKFPKKISDFDAKNPAHLSMIRSNIGTPNFNNVLGDLNGDGKAELFYCRYTRGQVQALSYKGGDIMNPANWVTSEGFYDNSYVSKPQKSAYADTNVYKKELGWWNGGVLSQIHGSYGIKMANDLDKDGKKELVISAIESPFSDAWLFVLEASATGVMQERWDVVNPDQYKLEYAYPNPFNATTSIEYTLPLDKHIQVRVYNAMGQLVATLVDRQMPAGTHRVIWDGLDSRGNAVATGMYLYSLEYGNFKQVKRMTLVK